MAKTPRFSTGYRNGLLDAGMLTDFDSGVLEIRTGTQPASANDAPAGSILASITLPADAFAAAASGGSLAKTGTWEVASATGGGSPAAWFRLKTSTDGGGSSTTDKRIDGSCGTTDADLILTTLTIANGDKVVIDTFNVNVVATP